MKPKSDPLEILRNIESIDRMERGKLCIIRQGPNGPYFNLQRREGGRNVSEYVPSDQIPQVQINIEAHDRFQALVGEYENLITEQTRKERKAGVKKNRRPANLQLHKKPKSKT